MVRMRRRWPLVLVGLCALTLVLSAFTPEGRRLGWRQTSEGNGYRSKEYGVFGVTLFQTSTPVSGLHVDQDFLTALRATGLKNPPEVEKNPKHADRTIRPGGTQYWFRMDTDTEPAKLLDVYRKQLKATHMIPGGGTELDGTAPDGKTHVRVYAAKIGSGKTDFFLTFGPGS